MYANHGRLNMRQPADNRKDKRDRPDRFHALGFTTVELLVSIALLGILLSLALPSYRDMVEKRRLTQGAEQIFAFLNSTQGVASRSNNVVTVSYSRTAEDNWCVGAIVGDTACDCTEVDASQTDFCAVDGREARLTNDHVGNDRIVEAMNGDGSYAYDPVRGLMTDLDDSLDIELHSPSDSYQLRLIVSNTGHAVLCSKDADHDVPGYALCQPETSSEAESG